MNPAVTVSIELYESDAAKVSVTVDHSVSLENFIGHVSAVFHCDIKEIRSDIGKQLTDVKQLQPLESYVAVPATANYVAPHGRAKASAVAEIRRWKPWKPGALLQSSNSSKAYKACIQRLKKVEASMVEAQGNVKAVMAALEPHSMLDWTLRVLEDSLSASCSSQDEEEMVAAIIAWALKAARRPCKTCKIKRLMYDRGLGDFAVRALKQWGRFQRVAFEGLRVLWNLSYDDAVQVHLHKLDAINHALAAMQWHITDEYVMLSGAQTLRSLVYNNAPAKETLVEGGGLEFLLTVFHSRLPSMIRATAAQALANAACKSERVVKALVKHRIGLPLMQLLQQCVHSQKNAEMLIALLCNMGVNKEFKKELYQPDNLEFIDSVLSDVIQRYPGTKPYYKAQSILLGIRTSGGGSGAPHVTGTPAKEEAKSSSLSSTSSHPSFPSLDTATAHHRPQKKNAATNASDHTTAATECPEFEIPRLKQLLSAEGGESPAVSVDGTPFPS